MDAYDRCTNVGKKSCQKRCHLWARHRTSQTTHVIKRLLSNLNITSLSPRTANLTDKIERMYYFLKAVSTLC